MLCFYYYLQISKRLRKKLQDKDRIRYARLWEKDTYNLKDIVRKKIAENNSKNNILHTSTVITEDDENSSYKLIDVMATYDFDNEEENESEQYITETPKEINIKKRSIRLFPDHSNMDENSFEISDDKLDNNEPDNKSDSICNKFDNESDDESNNNSTSDFLPPSKSPLIKRKYCIDYNEIQVNTHTLKHEDNSINKENVRAEICKFMLHKLKFPCPLAFFGGIRKNIDSYVTYARCRYVSHRISFRFSLIKLDEGICTFFTSSTKCKEIKHDGPTIFCSLRGSERKAIKEQLEHVPPRTLQRETAREIDSEFAQDGHMQNLRLLSTYQKAKSEHNCRNDRILSSSDLSDLFQQWVEDTRNKDPYIRYVGLPLYAIMYSQE